MSIIYKTDTIPQVEKVINLYNNAGLQRPTDDAERIKKMYANSNLVITAWKDELLVGVARCITDWCWSCSLADLAVLPAYQKEGIGKNMFALVREKVGEQTMILLLSVPDAFSYYPIIGFTKEDRAFVSYRSK